MVQDFVDRSCFDQLALLHDGDAVCNIRNNTEVMGDEEYPGVVGRLHLLNEFQDLRLSRYVQRSGWLIGDEDLGVKSKSHSNHRTLALPAGQLMWIGPHDVFRIGQMYIAQQGQRSLAPLFLLIATWNRKTSSI